MANWWVAGSSTCASTRVRNVGLRANGPCSANPSAVPIWPPWQRPSSNMFTTSGCRGCFTGVWFGLRSSGPQWATSTKIPVKGLPGVSESRSAKKFRRRGCAKALAGDAGRRETQDQLELRERAATDERIQRIDAAAPSTRFPDGGFARHPRKAPRRGQRGESDVPPSLPDARRYGQLPCAVADVQGDKATLCSPTQGVWYQKTTGAMILGLKPENVHVIFRRGAGCYGSSTAPTPA